MWCGAGPHCQAAWRMRSTAAHPHKAPMGRPPAVGVGWVANELGSWVRWGEVGVYTHRSVRVPHDVANWPRQQRENASTLSI